MFAISTSLLQPNIKEHCVLGLFFFPPMAHEHSTLAYGGTKKCKAGFFITISPRGHCVSGQRYLFYCVFLNCNFTCRCVTLSSYYSDAAVTVQCSTAAHPLLHLFLLCQSCHSVALAADSLNAYCAENRRSALAQAIRAKYLELKLLVAQRLIV